MDRDTKEVLEAESLPWIGKIEGRGSPEDGFDEGSGDTINLCEKAIGGKWGPGGYGRSPIT